MKILQINAWQGRLLRRLAKFIEHQQPDIVLLQEVYSAPKPLPPGAPFNQLDSLRRIQSASQLDHAYFTPSFRLVADAQIIDYGNAVLSRYPIVSRSEHYVTPFDPTPLPIIGSTPANPGRNFQHITIQTNTTPLHVINHHGYWIPDDQGDQHSVDKLLQLAYYARQLSGPTIIGGDFNVSPASPAARALFQALPFQDLVAQAQATTTLSVAHHVSFPVLCDYLLTSPEISIESVKVVDEIISDHCAIIATTKD